MKEHAYPVAPVQVSQAEEYSAWFTLLRAFNAGIGPDRPYAFLGMDKVTAGSTSTAATLPEDANSHKPNRVQIQVGERFPTAAETGNFDVVFRAAINDALDDCVQAGDVAPAGQDSNSSQCHTLFYIFPIPFGQVGLLGLLGEFALQTGGPGLLAFLPEFFQKLHIAALESDGVHLRLNPAVTGGAGLSVALKLGLHMLLKRVERAEIFGIYLAASAEVVFGMAPLLVQGNLPRLDGGTLSIQAFQFHFFRAGLCLP